MRYFVESTILKSKNYKMEKNTAVGAVELLQTAKDDFRRGRVSHSWCMCVVGQVYGGLAGGRDGGGGW